jgi:glutamate-1-semialdehyde 2,1-aminomutase
LIAKATGGYDGWYDEIRFGLVDSPESRGSNVRPTSGALTLLKVNDLSDLELLFQDHGNDLAAIIIEPVLGNAGCLAPTAEFFAELNRAARKHGVLIISDEVMVGLRLGLRPVSEQLGLIPDLMTMGKAIGSGLPVAAVLGTPEAFGVVESGKVVCYGTYQGNPVVTAAVSATIERLSQSDFTALRAYGERLRTMIVDAFNAEDIQVSTSGISTVFSLWFSEAPPKDYSQALDMVRREASRLVYEQLRREGVITLPSPWGRVFFSFAHGEEDFETSSRAFKAAAALLRESRLLERAA